MTVSIANLSTSSAQEVFDHVVNHLIEQNAVSYDSAGEHCAYRTTTAEGKVLRCAAGCLFTDEQYAELNGHRQLESKIWRRVVETTPGISGHHEDLITAMQKVHDSVDHVMESDIAIARRWHKGFTLIARGFGLSEDAIKFI